MKPFTLTRPQITAMIDEINEHITAVNYDTVRDVVATIFDSIDEDAYWTENGEPVTESELIALVNEWITDNGPTDPIKITMELAAKAARDVLESRAADIARTVPIDKLQYFYRAAYIMANTINPTPDYAKNIIAVWDAAHIPEYDCMARAWQAWINQRAAEPKTAHVPSMGISRNWEV
jgi:hypothetical protein